LIIAAVLYIFGGGHKQHTGNEGPYQYQQQQYGTDYRHAVYKFRNKRLLDEHFEKHGRNMGFASADDYQLAAVLVLNNPKSLHKYEKDDGDDVYYLETSNEIVIVSRDGYIRTYFKPNNGIRYYNSK
jgi:pyocin large subunit-like protein